MRTIVKFIDSDLVNSKVTLMVGLELKTISSKDYRMLQDLAQNYTTGLDIVTRKNGTTMKFISEHAFTPAGIACSKIIKRVLGLQNR